MQRQLADQRQRPAVTYLVTTLAAWLATLITALCSTTGHAADAAPTYACAMDDVVLPWSDSDIRAIVAYLGTLRC